MISLNEIPIDSLGFLGIYELLADTSINEYQFLLVATDGDTKDLTISVQPLVSDPQNNFSWSC